MPSDGVGLLSWQLATDRIFDGFEKRREQRVAQQNAQDVYEYLQSQIDELTNAHDQLCAECRQFGEDVKHDIGILAQRISATRNRNPPVKTGDAGIQSLEQQLASLKAQYEQLEKENDLHKRTIAEVERISGSYYDKANKMRMALINTQDELRKFTGERRPDPPEI